MPIELFGFQIGRKKKEETPSFAIPTNTDGAMTVSAGGITGSYIDLDGNAKNENDLINRYREMSFHPETEQAINDIVNEAIVVEDNNSPIKVLTDNLPYDNKTKKIIQTEFQSILNMLDFTQNSVEIFRRWYVDGRLYFHKIIDVTKPEEGLKELRYIDPRNIRKVREIEKKISQYGVPLVDVKDEYYVYNDQGIVSNAPQSNHGMKITTDSICYVHSGLVDNTRNMVLSHLHKAIKPLNQLRMMEDALVIYRLVRAPERRIFYIDVGTLPKLKAEQYMKDIMGQFRNKLIYDPATGEMRDDKKHYSMLEDYWLPRREGARGTEISTLEGGKNLSDIEDVKYFQEKLFKSLNVPISRMQQGEGFNLGRASEISRDELKFFKFIENLRSRFTMLFDDLLYTQLVLKGYISKSDWPKIRQNIRYEFAKDSYFTENKNIEVLRERIQIAQDLEPFVGKYFSNRYVRTHIFKQDEKTIEMMDEQIKQEIETGDLVTPEQEAAVNGTSGQPATKTAPAKQKKDDSSHPNKTLDIPDIVRTSGPGGASGIKSY